VSPRTGARRRCAVGADEQERDRVLRTEFVRVVGADGRAYLVERAVEG
jgi:hypothetical protein